MLRVSRFSYSRKAGVARPDRSLPMTDSLIFSSVSGFFCRPFSKISSSVSIYWLTFVMCGFSWAFYGSFEFFSPSFSWNDL